MNQTFTIIFLVLMCFLFSCGESNSKNDKSIIIEAVSEVSPITGYVGSEINYKIKITSKKNIEYKFYDITFDNTSDKSRILSSQTKTKNKRSYKETEIIYKLSFYDIGGFVISPFKIDYVYNGSSETLFGEEVKFIIKPFSDGEVLPPLKEIIKIKMPFYVWAVLAFVLIISALFVFLYLKRKNKINTDTSISENIFVSEDKEALRELESINIKNYCDCEEYAHYYFFLTEVFKRYLSKRYLVAVLEMTTSDFERNIKNNIVAKREYIIEFFKYADTIKFAKEKSNYETMKKHFNFCVEYIEKYKSREKILKYEIK